MRYKRETLNRAELKLRNGGEVAKCVKRLETRRGFGDAWDCGGLSACCFQGDQKDKSMLEQGSLILWRRSRGRACELRHHCVEDWKVHLPTSGRVKMLQGSPKSGDMRAVAIG